MYIIFLGAPGAGKGTQAANVAQELGLVHIATDKLFQDKPVIHVSYASRVDYVISWYEDIFREIAKKRRLESAVDVHDEIIKNRVIMSFKQDASRTDQVLKSVEAMIDCGNFAADAVIVDGYDFGRSTPEDLQKFKDFTQKVELEVWFSASLNCSMAVSQSLAA